MDFSRLEGAPERIVNESRQGALDGATGKTQEQRIQALLSRQLMLENCLRELTGPKAQQKLPLLLRDHKELREKIQRFLPGAIDVAVLTEFIQGEIKKIDEERKKAGGRNAPSQVGLVGTQSATHGVPLVRPPPSSAVSQAVTRFNLNGRVTYKGKGGRLKEWEMTIGKVLGEGSFSKVYQVTMTRVGNPSETKKRAFYVPQRAETREDLIHGCRMSRLLRDTNLNSREFCS